MNRKLKALGLALFAVLALGALTAGSASAAGERFHSDGTDTTLTLDNDGTQTFVTTVDELTCSTIEGSGTIAAQTASEVTLKVEYTGCKAVNKGLTSHVFMNGCDYVFTSELVGEHAPVHIVCPTGKEIEIKITIGGSPFNCVDVPAQTPTSGGLVYTNEEVAGRKTITAKATVFGITYTETGVCGTGESNGGTYVGAATVTGENSGGGNTDIWWE